MDTSYHLHSTLKEGIDYDPMAIKDLLKRELSFDEITADIPYKISDRIRSGQKNRFNSQ